MIKWEEIKGPMTGKLVLYRSSCGGIGLTRKIVLGEKLGAKGDNSKVMCARVNQGYSPNVTHYSELNQP